MNKWVYRIYLLDAAVFLIVAIEAAVTRQWWDMGCLVTLALVCYLAAQGWKSLRGV